MNHIKNPKMNFNDAALSKTRRMSISDANKCISDPTTKHFPHLGVAQSKRKKKKKSISKNLLCQLETLCFFFGFSFEGARKSSLLSSESLPALRFLLLAELSFVFFVMLRDRLTGPFAAGDFLAESGLAWDDIPFCFFFSKTSFASFSGSRPHSIILHWKRTTKQSK